MEPIPLVKKRQTRSKQRERRVLGEKGIGRLAPLDWRMFSQS